ncbi:OsmC family protein [Bradyrhizobium lablabi]|uniref:OsmC family protein n=1 Tax=Bradyrhizobium lablabi TaxID=722472 RepID=UPI001BA7B649|nr:OsmC family protein [Bradyrhizobium lablabi]MBR1124362.1 OsmC family protein [Bradyrhizobium lablabi]
MSNAVRANPHMARTTFAPVIATVDNRLRCRVTGASGEQIETDMPRAMGGENANPSPGWFFRASLAACCATMITAQAARLGIVLTKLEVRVGADGDTRGILGLDDISAGYSALTTDVEIGAQAADPEQLRDLVRWVEAHSPVGCTVRDSPPNTLRVVIADEIAAT